MQDWQFLWGTDTITLFFINVRVTELKKYKVKALGFLFKETKIQFFHLPVKC